MIENQNAKMVRKTVDYETITTLVKDMIQDSKLLKDGFKIFSNYEKDHHFYSNLLKLIFNPQEADDRVRKLACSTLHTFLRRNWSDDLYLTNEERMV